MKYKALYIGAASALAGILIGHSLPKSYKTQEKIPHTVQTINQNLGHKLAEAIDLDKDGKPSREELATFLITYTKFNPKELEGIESIELSYAAKNIALRKYSFGLMHILISTEEAKRIVDKYPSMKKIHPENWPSKEQHKKEPEIKA
ncbi:MAG: hypothetical protein AABW46_00080 [Nanoarchaeota archaeon]